MVQLHRARAFQRNDIANTTQNVAIMTNWVNTMLRVKPAELDRPLSVKEFVDLPRTAFWGSFVSVEQALSDTIEHGTARLDATELTKYKKELRRMMVAGSRLTVAYPSFALIDVSDTVVDWAWTNLPILNYQAITSMLEAVAPVLNNNHSSSIGNGNQRNNAEPEIDSPLTILYQRRKRLAMREMIVQVLGRDDIKLHIQDGIVILTLAGDITLSTNETDDLSDCWQMLLEVMKAFLSAQYALAANMLSVV